MRPKGWHKVPSRLFRVAQLGSAAAIGLNEYLYRFLPLDSLRVAYEIGYRSGSDQRPDGFPIPGPVSLMLLTALIVGFGKLNGHILDKKRKERRVPCPNCEIGGICKQNRYKFDERYESDREKGQTSIETVRFVGDYLSSIRTGRADRESRACWRARIQEDLLTKEIPVDVTKARGLSHPIMLGNAWEVLGYRDRRNVKIRVGEDPENYKYFPGEIFIDEGKGGLGMYVRPDTATDLGISTDDVYKIFIEKTRESLGDRLQDYVAELVLPEFVEDWLGSIGGVFGALGRYRRR